MVVLVIGGEGVFDVLLLVENDGLADVGGIQGRLALIGGLLLFIGGDFE